VQAAAKRVPVRVERLPVDFRALSNAVRRLVRIRPRALILIGEASGADTLRIERVALNLIDARIADNRRHRPVDVPVVRDGPDAHFATLPPKWVRRVLGRSAPVRLSLSAGAFACNAAFYLALHHARSTRVALIHVPASDRAVSAARAGRALANLAMELSRAIEPWREPKPRRGKRAMG
jgi:pyroglutamyl-peptidase